jgi:hypothetical protein
MKHKNLIEIPPCYIDTLGGECSKLAQISGQALIKQMHTAVDVIELAVLNRLTVGPIGQKALNKPFLPTLIFQQNGLI